MRIFTICFLTVFFIVTMVGSNLANALQKEGIVAVVNDDIITFSDLRNRVILNLSTVPVKITPEIKFKAERKSLDELINETLQMQEARKLGITVSPQQIKEGIAELAKRNGFNYDNFIAQMKGSGINPKTLEDKVKTQIAWSYVVGRKLRPKINVSESEIESKFKETIKKEQQTRYRLAEIVLKNTGQGNLEELVKTIMYKLRDGAPFSMLAQQFSSGAGANRGGDLGWLTEEQLPDEYLYAVNKMQVGQVTPPLRVADGYKIMLMIDKKEAGYNIPNIKKEKRVVGKDITISLKQILIPINKGEPESVIKAKITRAGQLKSEIKNCSEMEEKSKNFLSAGTGDINDIKLTDLPPKVAEVVKELPIGELTPPIRHSDGIAVMMVCKRNIEDIVKFVEVPVSNVSHDSLLNNEELRGNIVNSIGSQRLNRLQEHYLKDLRASAYIENRLN